MTDKRLRMPLDSAQVIIKWNLAGQPAESVFYCQHQHRDAGGGTWAPSDFNHDNADVVGGRLKAWVSDHWSPQSATSASATEVDVIWNTAVGTGPLQGAVYQDSDYPIPGSSDQPALPNNVTVAIELRTANLGRSFHGRSYYPGAVESLTNPAVDPNVVTPANVAILIAMYENLRTSMEAAEFSTLGVDDVINDRFPLVVMSFVGAGVERDPAVATQVTACTLSDPYVDSMRRRLPGHNRHH